NIGERTLVGPDNGFASDLLLIHGPDVSLYAIHDTWAHSEIFHARGTTFRGRDIFAPVAAGIALGSNPERFGRRVEGVVILRDASGVCLGGRVTCVRRRL